MKLSVFTVVPTNPIEREDTVVEGIKAALVFADEVIAYHHRPTDGTLESLINLGSNKLNLVDGGPWENDRFVVGRSKNAALQHCSGDWCLLMDADECHLVPDQAKLRETLRTTADEVNAYSVRYLHFYKDPFHVKTDPAWYKRKASLFRGHAGNFIGGYDICSNLVLDNHGQPASNRCSEMSEDILKIFHYGHCKTSAKTYGKKLNMLEATYMEDGNGQIDPGVQQWDMKLTKEFHEAHPQQMDEWIVKKFL